MPRAGFLSADGCQTCTIYHFLQVALHLCMTLSSRPGLADTTDRTPSRIVVVAFNAYLVYVAQLHLAASVFVKRFHANGTLLLTIQYWSHLALVVVAHVKASVALETGASEPIDQHALYTQYAAEAKGSFCWQHLHVSRISGQPTLHTGAEHRSHSSMHSMHTKYAHVLHFNMQRPQLIRPQSLLEQTQSAESSQTWQSIG